MIEPIIKVENLGKKYQIGAKESYYSLRDKISGIFDFKNKRNKEKSEFWALKDVDFEVKKGESVGIIGRNGAGKSTLLKILSQITPPTTGKITMRGRVASLLEVGTGFNQELTGRENIFLNGAILGMTREEIKRKFDEIVAFAEIEQFLDTPVKRYSSGMYMRLAFAVAAHLESEILIVDEVLAVGDSQFQKKCLGKMNDVTKNEGRTVLFVSHNMGAITQLCNRTIVLDNGSVMCDEKTDKAISQYLNRNKSQDFVFCRGRSSLKKINQFVTIYNTNSTYKTNTKYHYNDEIKLAFEVYLPEWNESLEVGIFPCDKQGRRIFMIEIPLKKYYSGNPYIKFLVTIPPEVLAVGEYSWEAFIHNPLILLYDHHREISSFSIIETGSQFSRYGDYDSGCVCPPAYSVIKL